MQQYILDDDNKPVVCEDIREWGKWFEGAKRRVGFTEFEGGHVSTVFLGLDHRFDNSSEPILWETMIFGGPHDQYQERYTSHADALKGHTEAVKLALSPLVNAE